MDNAKFMGRVTASASHDLCNVLATIQQASGLLADYMALARKESLKSMGIRPKFKYDQKFCEIICQIQAQVDRGQDICDHLSQLAHSADDGQDGADLARACRLMVRLSGREAKKRKVCVSVADIPAPCMAEATLVEALGALETGFIAVADACAGKGEIRLAPGMGCGETACVDILSQELEGCDTAPLAEEFNKVKPGVCKAGAIQGGVRLAFGKAGRKA